MGLFDFGKDQRDQVYDNDDHHEGKLSHELLGGAAAFEAMHLWENKQRKEGKTLCETKGLDFIDREKAKRHAEKQAQEAYDSHYGDLNEYDPNQRNAPEFAQY
ncbi:hypothetical protein P8C59_002815 [Phyllachora maydis]|uniref:CipC-like antibiotic response protein n=1 Tax=Phyllachora maydis TaxID=1825666 RepID=A0AAD9I0H1_9PEZI|nr:hypothetical protein P8C59_002815 [Phyllachora maydis]